MRPGESPARLSKPVRLALQPSIPTRAPITKASTPAAISSDSLAVASCLLSSSIAGSLSLQVGRSETGTGARAASWRCSRAVSDSAHAAPRPGPHVAAGGRRESAAASERSRRPQRRSPAAARGQLTWQARAAASYSWAVTRWMRWVTCSDLHQFSITKRYIQRRNARPASIKCIMHAPYGARRPCCRISASGYVQVGPLLQEG